jgi:hypothetical protein
MAEKPFDPADWAYTFYDHPQYGLVARCEFFINHPAEEIERHRGRCVAWSMDGRTVRASAATFPELFAEVRRLGLGDDDYVIDRIPAGA